MVNELLTLDELCKALGEKAAFRMQDDCFWTNFKQSRYLVTRYPLACMTVPPQSEIDAVFRELKPLLISYALPVDDAHKENSFLYISHDHEYRIEKLKPPQRRTTRKAMLAFEFKFITWNEFEQNGFKCFQDSRLRNALSDGTHNHFQSMITANRTIPSYRILAAIDPGTSRLAAVLVLNHIRDLVTTIGHYSDNDFLNDRPNNGLFHHLKEIFLVGNLVDTIEYGYSSIQKSSNHESLHFFKTSNGFDAIPISRKFIINPRYKLLFNPVTKLLHGYALKLFPDNKYLLKTLGLF